MSEPVTYVLVAGLTGVKQILTVTDDRFTAKAPLVNVDCPLAAVKHFCLEPVESTTPTHDSSLVMTWEQNGKTKSKRIPVKREEKSFQDFLAALVAKRPDASLLNMDYREALKKMGVMSLRKLAWIIVGWIFAVILLGVGIAVIVAVLKGE